MRKVKVFIVFVLALLLVGCGKTPSLSAENLTLEVGEEKQLLFNVKDTKKDVIFDIEDDTVASISDVGLVKGLKAGTTTLTVSVKNTDLKKTVTIEVKAVAVEITLEASGPEKLTVGYSGKIVVTTNDSLGVNYTSSDSEILTVDETGNINALKVGNAVITVESKTDNKVKKTVAIEVEEKLVINISSIDDFDVIEGEEKVLNVVHNDPLGITITSSDASIVSVNNLTITANKVGTVILTITSKTDDSITIEVEVTVVERPYVMVPNNEIALNINEEFDFEFDASHDVLIVVSDESIISLDNGIITALKEGVATITLSLKDYPSIKEIVTVTVYPDIVVEGIVDLKISVGESKEIPFTSLNDLTFTSSDKTIFTIENNVITGVKSGSAKIIITSKDNPAFSLETEVVILGMPTRVTLTAERELVIGEETLIITNFTPLNTFSPMRFESSDESVLTVDENGLVTAVGGGKATVTATSIIEPLLNAKISFTVELINAVKPDLKEGEIIEANGFSFRQGLNAFNTLEEALVGSPKEIIMVGEYNDGITISQPIVLLGTTNTVIKNVVTINSSNITFRGFNFSGAGKIVVNEGLENVVLSENKFNNLNYKTAPIYAERQKNLEISYNTLNLNKGVGIEVFNPTGNVILVKGNIITNATTAVVVKATENYSTTLSVQVMWNKIDNVDLGFDIDLAYQEEINHAKSYVRFNELTNYVNAVIVPSVNKLDFNLNYWGGTPELVKFVNLTEDDLDGFYLDKTEILPEELYSPNGPSYVKILTELVEVDIDEEITVQIKVLPKDIQASSYQLLTGDATTMTVDSSYTIRFKKSGFVELILRSVVNTSIEHRVRFEVIANPGIEIIPEEAHNQILVGDTLKFDTIVFPKRYENEPVVFSVDNNNIATIDEKGVLTAVGAGLVTIKVERASNHEIYQIFRLEIYDELDENNIMDFIASSMLIYTTPRSFLTYGGTNILYESYDSVSRIIFEELYRNKEKMIPVCGTLSGSQKSNCEKLRPGTRPAIPSNVQTYNNKNVHYVTFHETGNTNPNQGALSHANYLINQVNGTTELRQASWHFTIDDKELYQHLPTDEMAWHAGDGSRLAGTTWSDNWGNQNIGGGNTHSIAIESSVARTDDILRVWQRGAKLIAQLTKEYNLPKENVKFHYDFSSKICPQSMIMANLTGYFYEFVAYEYKLHHDYEDAVIVFTSHDPEYVDHAGRVIKLPDAALNVSFTLKVTYQGEVFEKTFYSYLPGTIH